MMFTRQTARKSTGGKAPRKQVGSKSALGLNSSNARKYQINISELKAKHQQQLSDQNNYNLNDDADLKKFIDDQYENCDDLVKKWIHDDLVNQKEEIQQSDSDVELDTRLLKELDENTKFEILQFIPTFSPNVANQSLTEERNIEMNLDTELIRFHKMRLINKSFNKIMMKKILTLKHITLKTATNTLNYISLLSIAQKAYKQAMMMNSNHDLNIDNVLLYNPYSSVEIVDNNQSFGFNNFGGFSTGLNSFGGFSTGFGTFGTTASSILQNTNEIPSDSRELISEDSEDELIAKLYLKREDKKNPQKVDIDYMREEVYLYTHASHTTSQNQSSSYPPVIMTVNETIETLTLVMEDQYLAKDIVGFFSKLKRLNIFMNNATFYYGEVFNLASESLEEVLVCGAGLLELLINQPYLLSSFSGASCPKMTSVTFSPLLPNIYAPENILDTYFSQLQVTNPTIHKLNIYDKIGRNESAFIKSEVFTTTNPVQRELNVYCVQYKSLVNIDILEELYDIFGDRFVKTVMPFMILGYNCPVTLEHDQSLWKSHFVEHMKKFKDTANYLFKKRKFPVSNVLLSFDIMTNNVLEQNIKDSKLQYLIYLCNQYQNSKLLSYLPENKQTLSTIIASIYRGWNFTKYTNDLLEFFVRAFFHRGVSAMLHNFKYDEKFIVSQIEYLATSYTISSTISSRAVITEIIIHLFRNNSKVLYSLLAKQVEVSDNNTTFTIPFIAFLFGKADCYLIAKLFNEMDMETFNSLGQNNRGDNILHIYVYFQQEFNYLIFYSILNKNPNLINMVNHKLQTPLHYLMTLNDKRSPLLLPEINQLLKRNNILLDMNVTDYMEQTPMSILKSEEYEHEDIMFE
ncbi:predicted protein [Naegleria gruberi]|uniref:Predicted protein n=1 Tax=Naegleria gruberi TaxID=5762 RepID=D2VTJ1_NAEGR|nr:uncharacterized protein NAEGRDRAFT_72320 [Naegleria gruberi]EFC39868.1 predicted protein [Naegleria gruberi]|eukprot:XP_002672612.1 predicted protein [Naegleria gruberi strain NEG-M]